MTVIQKQTNLTRVAIAGTAGVTLAASLAYAGLVYHQRGHRVSDAVLRMALRVTWREARATAKGVFTGRR